jgi:hypothetical protein
MPATLQQMMTARENNTARISGAKILLERLAPKEDDKATKRAARRTR